MRNISINEMSNDLNIDINVVNNNPNEDNLDKEYSVIKEGKADIIQPLFVFYNRVQEFNRDLRSILKFISNLSKRKLKSFDCFVIKL
jgi:hypothetical protein